ncbi:MAG: hypothetical protein K6F73_05565 [Lachnospiraceae bacterium]|nr:hypothetical protein [Lachnospiraceae bacterium]
MRKFVGKIILLALIAAACFFAAAAAECALAGSQYGGNYQASINDKTERLLALDSPKIILVGNSNLPFGMDSKLLEEQTGLPVVNLGLHGGLGNAFHEDLAKINIGEGDLVIICHTDFDDDIIPSPSLAWITIDDHWKYWKILRIKDYPRMMAAYPNYIRKSLYLWITKTGNKDEGDSYARSAFNEYGDVVNKPSEDQMEWEKYFSDTELHPVEVPDISRACVKRMNRFAEYVRKRGATPVVAAYPIAYGKYSSFSKEDFEAFAEKLSEELDCDVISDYTDYFYPYEYFYDTNLHLTEEGARIRTQQLISDIIKWKQNQQED